MNIVSLGRRFASTLIDKLLIFVLFVITALILSSGVPGAELGTFTGLLGRPYKQIESTKTIYEHNVESRELCLKASVGKKIMKCRIRKKDNSNIENQDVLIRTGILGTLLLLAVALQMSFNMNAYITSVLFFAILDFTVFTKGLSLADKYSDTVIVTVK